MQRNIMSQLINWKDSPERLPLLVRGARQVGKTYAIEQFAKEHFEFFVNINFELEPSFANCFQTLKPKEIIANLSLLQNASIIPGKTLVFLDEIQICPNAIMALRYFKEQMPELHIIGAGSLLEFSLNSEELRVPVGRIQYLFMYPLSFAEFLLARGKDALLSHLQKATLQNIPSEIAHNELLKLLREYFILGGMPAVVDNYVKLSNLGSCQNLQSSLIATYRNDFGKYARHAQLKHLIKVFDKTPNLIGKQVKYSHFDSEHPSRDIKAALSLLQKAGVLYKVYAANCTGLPLNSLINEKIFKLLFIDIGLVNRTGKVNIYNLMSDDLILINQGAQAEQFVGQELLTIQNPYEEAEVYYWNRDKPGSLAEVDYVINLHGAIVPIEVKSGKTGKLRSLKQFLHEKNTAIGVQISQQPLAFKDNILSVPLYMISELPRILLYER
ncbi:MAG: AAA family ATPase [Gammaproteobacteria bacterium]|nr:AAA family ATPase [Gammaproteobacteria bacterium]